MNDKVAVIDRDALLSVLKVSPVNLDMATETDQNALHQFFRELLDKVPYPIYLYSRQSPTDLGPYIERITGGEGHEKLRSEYVDHLRSLSQSDLVETRHFIAVRTTDQYESPGKELYRRIREIRSTLQGFDLEVEQVTGRDLFEFLKQEFNPSPVSTREFCTTSDSGFNTYRKLLYVDEYPRRIGFGWPRHVQRVDGLVDIAQVFEPVSIDTAVDKLRRQSRKLDAEITAFQQHGHRGTNHLERSLSDVEWFLDLLADQECLPVRHGCYITVHGTDRGQVEATSSRVESQLRALGIEYQEPMYRNDHAYYTDSVFYRDRLDEKLLMPTVSAATGFPFSSQPLENDTGVLYGVDVESNSPVVVDRFSWSSHSMAVTGTLGAGKSYLAQLELLRSVLAYPGLRIVVVDPKKEFRPTVEAIGGESRLLRGGKEYSFDREVLNFEPSERGGVKDPALVELVKQIYSSVSKDREKTIVLVDEAHNLLKDETGRRILNKFVLEARDINTAVHLVSQNASHFTEYSDGREILDHTPGKLFFRHDNIEDSMIDYFGLSDQEIWLLERLKSGEEADHGEALLKVAGKVDARIRISSTPREHRIIETEPETHQQEEVVTWVS
ncbi:VirB4 family type IV secretion system protein [Natronobacterium texcoconense]|uniref:AAA-like domain-containing protein n=1 Tax=Natronobacterium texcoconense TaxID=1095778 RepID=A0A1H1AM17_NATTX|nr:ATP-binding protein [Natronobacterium texcoconense]SDQ40692.1 AAA-like domain-containing protein [Natronobacterium texcoconense]